MSGQAGSWRIHDSRKSKQRTKLPEHFQDNFDIRCRGGCEYCSNDASDIDDLLETKVSDSSDPRKAVLRGSQAELFGERVVEIRSASVSSQSSQFKDNKYTKMSSSRRSSKGRGDDSEFFLECKAAFLSIYDDIDDRIESRKQLLTVLQQSGRNPSNRALEKYWPRQTDELSFNEFVDICRKEPVTTTDDLMKAFRKIDINGDGYISLDELYKIMSSKGEKGEPMSRDEVRNMIDEVDENKDGRLDYGEFCNMIMKTTNDCKKMSMKVMERKERKKKGKSSIRPDISGTTQEKSKEEHSKQSHHHQQQPHSSKHSDKTEPSKVITSKDSDKTPKDAAKKTPRDAEQVDEAIEVNDDLDIISTGRPTPRIDLKTTPRKETSEEKENKKLPWKEISEEKHSMKSAEIVESKSMLKSHKGKSHDKNTHALHSLESGNGKGSVRDEKTLTHRKGDAIESARSVTEKEGPKSARNYVLKEGQETHGKEQQDDDPQHTARIMEEIFKTTARSGKDVELELYDSIKTGEKRPEERRSSSSDTKPPLPKERNHTHSALPAVEVSSVMSTEEAVTEKSGRREKQDIHKEKDSKLKSTSELKLKENGYGSQSSLRSGESGVPVPSPRKAVNRLSEDEMPKPSPRLRPRDQKTKSTSKARDKLPDPRSLRDWTQCRSKGCFFYEDDEIVTHVYSLKLSEDSTVFLSACPIQEPPSLALPTGEPVDTALYILDHRGKLVTFTEQKDFRGKYGVKCDLSAGEYQIIPYTTGCRFKQRSPNDHIREAKLIKKDREDKLVITSAFRKALEDIFDLCDLDENGTMSKDEFNWFNVRTSGEELGDDEWGVVGERLVLENGEITKAGFIELNEMEAEDSEGDVEDLWITLTSMGLNKALIMDEACPYRVEVYVERTGRRSPKFKCTGIESLQKKELVQEICQSVIEQSQSDPVKIRNMKDLYMHTYKNDHRATIALENRSRSRVNVEIDCNKSKNAVSHRDSLDHNVEVEPQSMAIAHHLVPAREGADWSVICTETVLK